MKHGRVRLVIAAVILVAVASGMAQVLVQPVFSEVPVNRDYFESAALTVFHGAVGKGGILDYDEQKSAYSSDFRAAARIPPEGLGAVQFSKPDTFELGVYASIAKTFPSIAVADLGQPDGIARDTLASGNGEATLYRFERDAAILVIQDF